MLNSQTPSFYIYFSVSLSFFKLVSVSWFLTSARVDHLICLNYLSELMDVWTYLVLMQNTDVFFLSVLKIVQFGSVGASSSLAYESFSHLQPLHCFLVWRCSRLILCVFLALSLELAFLYGKQLYLETTPWLWGVLIASLRSFCPSFLPLSPSHLSSFSFFSKRN